MSYTQFACTARCKVADTFNLKEYLTSLSDFIANHIDDDNLHDEIRWSFEDFTQDDVIAELEMYVRHCGDELLIECDSEDKNGNPGILDWLVDQVRQDVMISNVMRIESASFDSRNGVDCGTSYYLKNGTFIASEDVENIIEQFIKISE